MRHYVRLFSIIIGCLLTLYILGCGSDEDEEPTNSSPTVDSFIVPKEFSLGDVLEFKVIAHDEDGDALSYTWEVDGKILDETGTSAKWTASEDVDSVKVTVHISDGAGNTTKRVKTITNKEFIPPDSVVPTDGEIDAVPDPPLNLILPGKGAFGVKLGDPFKKVEAIHGEADGPIGVDRIFTYWDPDKGLAGHVDGIGLVEDLFLSRPNRAKTAGGNGIGSKLDAVKREFGNPEDVDEDGFGGLRQWYFQRGILFTVDEDESVLYIFVFKPVAVAPDEVGIQERQNANAPKKSVRELHLNRTKQSSSSDN